MSNHTLLNPRQQRASELRKRVIRPGSPKHRKPSTWAFSSPKSTAMWYSHQEAQSCTFGSSTYNKSGAQRPRDSIQEYARGSSLATDEQASSEDQETPKRPCSIEIAEIATWQCRKNRSYSSLQAQSAICLLFRLLFRKRSQKETQSCCRWTHVMFLAS